MLKIAQRWPEIAPRLAKTGVGMGRPIIFWPKMAEELANVARDSTKVTQDRSEEVSETGGHLFSDPEVAQEGAEVAQDSAKVAQDGAKMAVRWLQGLTKEVLDLGGHLRYCPKVAQELVKVFPR